MFKKGQLVRHYGMKMLVEVDGVNTSTGEQVLGLSYAAIPFDEWVRAAKSFGASVTLPASTVVADAKDCELIGNNYQAKLKCSR